MLEPVDFPQLKGTALFKVLTKKRLAELLLTSEGQLKKLVVSDELYCSWTETKKNGGTRDIEAPYPHLKKVQKRVANLLQAIEAPDYLMAPVKNHSYVTNAAHHIGSRSYRLLDIEDFFPSCSEKRVFWFFNTCMQCNEDVSAILAAICTRNGRLPQGSPCSPILAFFSYIDMWEEIAQITKLSNNKLSIYADDITISGDCVLGETVWLVKQALQKCGHTFNIKKERSLVNKPVEITGVIVSTDKLFLPNRQHEKLYKALIERSVIRSSKAKAKLDQKIRGRVAQANQILNHPLVARENL